MADQFKRKRIYVDRGVQGGIVARLVVLWVGSTAVATAVWVVMQFFADPTGGIDQYLENAGRHIAPLLLAFAVTLPIALLQLLRFTHRFAGPVVRLRRMMKELASGQEVPHLKFRDGDYWPELAEQFNVIAQQLTEARRRVAELEADATDREGEQTASSVGLPVS